MRKDNNPGAPTRNPRDFFHVTQLNLGNPTSFVFDRDSGKVEAVLEKLDRVQLSDVEKVSRIPGGGTRIVVFPHYSSNYWKGPRETAVDPPEAGKIGEISASFSVKVTPMGNQTLVSVE